MNLAIRNSFATRIMLFLATLGMLAACVREDEMNAGEEEVTVKLKAGTRAPGDPDELVRDDDDRFSSLAIYAFDKGGNFLALYTYRFPEAGTHTTPAFNCGIKVKKLLAIANYADYDLETKLVKGLSEQQVKETVANESGNTALGANNILMVGEASCAFSKPANEDENITVDISLKRLAARVDLFVYKTAGWDAEVKVTRVEFSGGVKNTTLDYTKGEVDVPQSPAFAGDGEQTFTPDETANPPLETFEGENATMFQQEAHLRGRFYTYRTEQGQESGHAPRLAVTVRVNDNIEKTYTAILADKDAAPGERVTLDAGNVYRICAVLTKTGLVIEMQVADWESEEEDALDFQYPTYENPLRPFEAAPELEPPFNEATVYYNPDENATEGTCRFSFSLTAPQGQTWRPTLLDAGEGDFTVEVYQDEKKIDNPVASDRPFEIRVKAMKPENVDRKVTLGIAFTPAWDPLSQSLLKINGNPSESAWTGSNDPARIVIKQVDPPVSTK